MNLKKNQMIHILALLFLGGIGLLFSGCLKAGLKQEQKAAAKEVNIVWLEAHVGYNFGVDEQRNDCFRVRTPCYVKKGAAYGDYYLYNGYVSVYARSTWGLDSKLDDAASKKYPVVCYIGTSSGKYDIEDVEDYQE